MIAFQIRSLPDLFSRFGIEASRSIASEVKVNTARFDRGRGAGIAIGRVAETWCFVFVNQQIIDDLSGIQPNANSIHFGSVVGGRGEPDLVSQYDRRRPTFPMYFGFPFEIL